MIGKVLGMTALGVGAYTAYRMMQPSVAMDGGNGGTLEVPYPLGMGSSMTRWRRRIAAMVAGNEYNTLEDLEAGDEVADTGSTSFQWAFGSTEASAVTTALAMERIVTEPPTPSPQDELLMTDKLESAGIHRDEESRDAFHPVPRSHVSGHASPRRLARAIERALGTENVGVIVDTSKTIVEIDEHHDVGRGNVLLIDGEGTSKLLRHGSMRSLVAALSSASSDDRSSSPS
ncbi:MAG: hypothetical protein DWI48_02185 [Chloroflexi bacterium]|nr:MAG: hypothetical protein DWI48_02185 [Chloroflexota bacterium]